MSQESPNPSSIGKIEILDDGMNKLVSPDAEIELLATGFEWSEGPLWIHDEKGGFLIFSDIPNNSVMKWSQTDGLSLFMKPSGFTGIAEYGDEAGSNGLTMDHEGRIIFCEHGDRRISRLEKAGGKKTLADSYKGKRLNSPNDAVVKSNGDIYFTDPPYGLPKGFEDSRRELDYCGVYLLSTSGELTLLAKEMTRPNGIAFSPDEKVLYVAQSDSDDPIIKTFPVKSDGTLDTGKILFEFKDFIRKYPGSPDGLKVDKNGNLFATGPGGVYVITPEGKLLGRIHTGRLPVSYKNENNGVQLEGRVIPVVAGLETATGRLRVVRFNKIIRAVKTKT
jgi:gluconolactonase